MRIITNSGAVNVNKKTRYAQWLSGRVDANLWTGANTVRQIWEKHGDKINKMSPKSAYIAGAIDF